jgi:hypothetical protein
MYIEGFTPINSTTLGLAKPNPKPANTWQLDDLVTCFIFQNYVFQWWDPKNVTWAGMCHKMLNSPFVDDNPTTKISTQASNIFLTKYLLMWQ